MISSDLRKNETASKKILRYHAVHQFNPERLLSALLRESANTHPYPRGNHTLITDSLHAPAIYDGCQKESSDNRMTYDLILMETILT